MNSSPLTLPTPVTTSTPGVCGEEQLRLPSRHLPLTVRGHQGWRAVTARVRTLGRPRPLGGAVGHERVECGAVTAGRPAKARREQGKSIRLGMGRGEGGDGARRDRWQRGEDARVKDGEPQH